MHIFVKNLLINFVHSSQKSTGFIMFYVVKHVLHGVHTLHIFFEKCKKPLDYFLRKHPAVSCTHGAPSRSACSCAAIVSLKHPFHRYSALLPRSLASPLNTSSFIKRMVAHAHFVLRTFVLQVARIGALNATTTHLLRFADVRCATHSAWLRTFASVTSLTCSAHPRVV